MWSLFYLLAQHRQHGRWDRPSAIRNKERHRSFRPARFHFFQQVDDALRLVFAYVRCHTQLGIALYTTSHVEFADVLRRIRLGEVPVLFFTNVHNSSSWASLR